MDGRGDVQLFLQILEKANNSVYAFIDISLGRNSTVVACQMDKVHQLLEITIKIQVDKPELILT